MTSNILLKIFDRTVKVEPAIPEFVVVFFAFVFVIVNNIYLLMIPNVC